MRKAPIRIFQNSHLPLVCQGAIGVGLLPTGERPGSTGWARCSQQDAVPQHPDPTEVRRVMTPTDPITFQRASGQRGNRPGIRSVPSFPHSTWETGLGAGTPTEQLRRGLEVPAWCSPCSVSVGGGPKWGWPGHLRTISALRALTQYHLLRTVTLQ